MKKSVVTLLLTCCLLLVSLPFTAQAETTKPLPDNVPGLLRTANNAYSSKDYPTFRNAMVSLNKMRPYNSDYMYQLVVAYALLDEKSKAYDVMLRMQQQGLAYDFNESENVENIKGTQVYDYVNDLMKAAAKPMGSPETVFVLTEGAETAETIAWDESRKKFLIGTVSQGSILAVGMDGQVSELLKADSENGLWAILDIKVDHVKNRLWVSSASTTGFSRFDPVDKGRSALFEFELDSLKLVNRFLVPIDGRAHILGSMVFSPGGDIYIVDRNLPLIYKKSVDEQKIKPVLALKEMISMRGAAMGTDGRFMYVADREMGISVVEMATGKVGSLAIPGTLNLGGIDGLYFKDNRLFIIQNGIKPQRVMGLQLDPSGLEVTEVVPLAVAHPDFDDPNYGTIQSEYLYYFANSQWEGDSKSDKAVTLLRSSLNSTEELVQPDISLFLEKQAKAQAKKLEEQKQAEEKN